MKTVPFLFSVALALGVPALAWSASSPCEQRAEELRAQGKVNVSCKKKTGGENSVDFNVRTFSADYENSATAPVTAAVGMIRTQEGKKVYQEQLKKDYGIKNLYSLSELSRPNFANLDKQSPQIQKYVQENGYGESTFSVFRSALGAVYPDQNDPDFKELDDLQESLSPDTNSARQVWEGKCLQWSAWNISDAPLDLDFKNILRGMKRGILCDGKWPLTRGMLKQIWTGLTITPYPDEVGGAAHDYRQINLTPNLRGNPNIYSDQFYGDIENANAALMKLGEFGKGSEFSPENILPMAAEALARGEKIVFDSNPGSQQWNQPVESMYELTYEDPKASESDHAYYTAKDFTAVDSVGQNILGQINDLELHLAAKGKFDDESMSAFCPLLTALQYSCDRLPARALLTEQVNFLKGMEKVAENQGKVKLAAPPVIHHEVVIQYGNEGEYGDSDDAPPERKILQYIEVNGRTQFATPTKRLSQACADHDFGRRNEHDTLVGEIQCPVPEGKDRDIFVGDLPPKNFKIFHQPAEKKLTGLDLKRQKAQKKLLKLIHEHCPSFDAGAKFLNVLKLAMANNVIDENEIKKLVPLFEGAKSYLSADFIQEAIIGITPIGQTHAPIQGIDQLKRALGI